MKNSRVLGCCVILLSILTLSLLNGCSNNTDKTVSGSADTDSLDAIKKEIQELNNKKLSLSNELAETQNKYVPFSVQGQIIGNRSSGEIHIFGTAMPSNSDWSHEGVVSQKGNITIREPRKENILPSHYTDFEVYYVSATTGKNAFGASVPVHIYTTEAPSNIDKLKGKIADIGSEIDELNQKYATTYAKWKEALLSSIKDNPQELIKHGDDFKAKGDADDAFRAYKRVLELTPNNADVHVSLADIYLTQDNHDAAIEEYNKALLINPKHTAANKNLGDVLFNVKRDVVAATKAYRGYLYNADKNNPDYSKIEGIVAQSGSDDSYQKQGTELRQEMDKLEYELKRSEKSGSKGEVDYYKGELEKTKKEYSSHAIEANKVGVESSLLQKDLKDDAYYRGLEEEASTLDQTIRDYNNDLAIQEEKIDEEKRDGYYRPDEWRDNFISDRKKKIDLAQQRLRKIKSELASRSSQ
jgi:Tfp pilus assembly protein PilF